jgi:hypothetical protein
MMRIIYDLPFGEQEPIVGSVPLHPMIDKNLVQSEVDLTNLESTNMIVQYIGTTGSVVISCDKTFRKYRGSLQQSIYEIVNDHPTYFENKEKFLKENRLNRIATNLVTMFDPSVMPLVAGDCYILFKDEIDLKNILALIDKSSAFECKCESLVCMEQTDLECALGIHDMINQLTHQTRRKNRNGRFNVYALMDNEQCYCLNRNNPDFMKRTIATHYSCQYYYDKKLS